MNQINDVIKENNTRSLQTKLEVEKSKVEVVSLSMSQSEARQLFKFSYRSAGVSINEFKGISVIWQQSQGNYKASFNRGVSKQLILPEYIGEKPVVHIAVTMLPDDAVIICNGLVYQKLKRPVRISTACAYLEDPSIFPNIEIEEIRKFIKKYSSDVANQILESGSVKAISKFFDLGKLTTRIYDEMLVKASGRAELTALILENKSAKKSGKQKPDAEVVMDLLLRNEEEK